MLSFFLKSFVESRAGKACHGKEGYTWSGYAPDGVFRKFRIMNKQWQEEGKCVLD